MSHCKYLYHIIANTQTMAERGRGLQILWSLCHQWSCILTTTVMIHSSCLPVVYTMESHYNMTQYNTILYTTQQWWSIKQVDSFVQDCSNSSALALELLQYCTKLSMQWNYCSLALGYRENTLTHKSTPSIVPSQVSYGESIMSIIQ